MDDCDNAWLNFCDTGELDDNINNNKDTIPTINCDEKVPKSTSIYISTKTKIAYLDKPIDLKECFWKIFVMPYGTRSEGVIKKQMKFNFVDEEDVLSIQDKLKKENYCDEHIITHIRNPEGKIKFKDIRKVSVGICKKDITSYRCKQKSAFYNCFVLIIRLQDGDNFKESHVKIFNTGKLELPGIQTDKGLTKCLHKVLEILNGNCGLNISLKDCPCETVLINSNFNCGYYIDRDKLCDILKYKYHLHTSYDPCSYPGIMSKFYYNSCKETQNGIKDITAEKHVEMSFMIFRTGSVLIVGKCEETELIEIYEFLKKILHDEYNEINQPISAINEKDKKVHVKKTRKRMIVLNIN
jgi:TATA-box binding protein (TBP) (component of TFIID and TFIIIB)